MAEEGTTLGEGAGEEREVIIREIDLGGEMVLAEVLLRNLRDAEMNARSMPKSQLDILVDNIRRRGKLESVLYCAQPDGKGHVTIVSGHNRRRAAIAAGLTTGWALIDRAKYTRSQLVAKQLAHNALCGFDDGSVVKEMLKWIDNAEDLLASGIQPEEVKWDPTMLEVELLTPKLDFPEKTAMFAFLPHQFDALDRFFGKIDRPVDVMIVGHEEQWTRFVTAVARFGRVKNIRAGATAIAELIKLAEETYQKRVEQEKAKKEEEEKLKEQRRKEREARKKAEASEVKDE